jgi:hypothetical protein
MRCKALDDVVDERKRQIEAEGWTEAHDDKHEAGDLAKAGAAYAAAAGYAMHYALGTTTEAPLEPWPWEAHWWKCSHPRRALVKAAALILAEIERYDRELAKEDVLHGNKTPNARFSGGAEQREVPAAGS